MIILNQIEISSNGRNKKLEPAIQTNMIFNDSRHMELFRNTLIEEKTKQYNMEVITYFTYTEK